MGNTEDFDGTSEGIGGSEDDNPIDLRDNDFSFTPAQTSSARGVSSTKRKRQSIDTCEPITEDSLLGVAMMLSEKLESVGGKISRSLGTELTLQQKIEQLESKLSEIEGLPYDDKFMALIKLPEYPNQMLVFFSLKPDQRLEWVKSSRNGPLNAATKVASIRKHNYARTVAPPEVRRKLAFEETCKAWAALFRWAGGKQAVTVRVRVSAVIGRAAMLALLPRCSPDSRLARQGVPHTAPVGRPDVDIELPLQEGVDHPFEPNFPAKANNNIVLPELDGPKSSVILQKKILDSETVTFLQANECEQIKLSKAHRKNYCRSEGRTAVADCSQRSSKPKVFTAAAGADTVEARLTFVANPREEERRRNDGDW
nr:DNA replication terminus site-binding [Ipomoea batatas]